MKKILIIAIALFMSVSALSQIKYGVKAGVNVSHLSGIDFGDGHGQTGGSSLAYGFHAGVYANYSFSQVFGFQPEAVFSMQGGRDPGGYGLGIKGGTIRFNYINIPLLLEIKPFKSAFSFLAGPQFGLCISRSFIDGILIYKNEY